MKILRSLSLIIMIVLLAAAGTTSAFAGNALDLSDMSLKIEFPAMWNVYRTGAENSWIPTEGNSPEEVERYCIANGISLLAANSSRSSELTLFAKAASHNDISSFSEKDIRSVMKDTYGLKEMEKNLSEAESGILDIGDQKFYIVRGTTEIDGQQAMVDCYATVNNSQILVFRFVSRDRDSEAEIKAIMNSCVFSDRATVSRSQLMSILVAVLFFLIAFQIKRNQLKKAQRRYRA